VAIQLQGGTSGVVADVNASKELLTAARVVDRYGESLTVTEDDHLMISPETLLFFEQVDGAAVNILKWAPIVTTMTIAQATGFITLNNSAITTINTSAMLTSIRQFPLYGGKPFRAQFNAKPTAPQANATMEMGVGFVTGTASPTDGAFFRWTPAGTFIGVANRGGTELVTAALTAPDPAVTALFEIVIVEDLVQFFINDTLVATLATAPASAYPVDGGHQPVFARVYTAGVAPGAAPQLAIGQATVLQESIQQNKRWADIQVSLGHGCYQSPVTAFGQTANFANNTAPTSASLANATAGYTTLGGKWQFAAVAGAETDYPLFSYTVPTGFQLYVTGLVITAMNMVVPVATTPTLLEWGLGLNASAITLLTVDGANTWGARRIPVGQQSFPVGAAVGATTNDIVRTFDPPLVVDSGRQFQVILRMPVATATATEIFRGGVGVTGYFE
jgi:hypothetical protein